MMVLDDLHAADEDSLMLLRFLARELKQARILVVATFRELEVKQSARMRACSRRSGARAAPCHCAG